MAIRKMVKIDEELCTGCGDCVPACAEGAIEIVDGVAKLVADNLCDGLGACLGDCPEGAISIEEREADEFDVNAVEERLNKNREQPIAQPTTPARPAAGMIHDHAHGPGGGCPGAKMIQFDNPSPVEIPMGGGDAVPQPSMLRQWPIQLHLVPPTAPYFKNSDVVLAADCVAFAIGDFHRTYLKDHSLAIACPKLDSNQDIYLSKLVSMIDEARINTLTVMIMQVPCCGGLLQLAKQAAEQAQRKVPVKQVVVGLRGEILAEDWV